MKNHHKEFESVQLRLGMQVGVTRFDKKSQTIDLLPQVTIARNYHTHFGIGFEWLIVHINFYVITRAYAQDIVRRRVYIAHQINRSAETSYLCKCGVFFGDKWDAFTKHQKALSDLAVEAYWPKGKGEHDAIPDATGHS
jgi:hypothetical protein